MYNDMRYSLVSDNPWFYIAHDYNGFRNFDLAVLGEIILEQKQWYSVQSQFIISPA
jgi:hypothetical protein